MMAFFRVAFRSSNVLGGRDHFFCRERAVMSVAMLTAFAFLSFIFNGKSKPDGKNH